jgi:hypothetical protein
MTLWFDAKTSVYKCAVKEEANTGLSWLTENSNVVHHRREIISQQACVLGVAGVVPTALALSSANVSTTTVASLVPNAIACMYVPVNVKTYISVSHC